MVGAGRKANAREDDALRAQRATSGKPRGSCSHPTRASYSVLRFPSLYGLGCFGLLTSCACTMVVRD